MSCYHICLPPADLILSVGSWSQETEPTQTQALWQVVWRQHLLWRGPGASASQDHLLISQYQQEILFSTFVLSIVYFYILLENIKNCANCPKESKILSFDLLN